jgi:TRAP-type C4-dicarboxylate transport system permease small subunit
MDPVYFAYIYVLIGLVYGAWSGWTEFLENDTYETLRVAFFLILFGMAVGSIFWIFLILWDLGKVKIKNKRVALEDYDDSLEEILK